MRELLAAALGLVVVVRSRVSAAKETSADALATKKEKKEEKEKKGKKGKKKDPDEDKNKMVPKYGPPIQRPPKYAPKYGVDLSQSR